MAHKRLFEALDRTMKDLKDNDMLFGGVPLIIAGDFRQVWLLTQLYSVSFYIQGAL